MAYYMSANISRMPINMYQHTVLLDNGLHINKPTNVIIIVAPSTTTQTCIRVNAACKFVYAENVDIDIRVPPRRLICRNCIVRLPALYAGILLSIKNCTVACNSAIATSTTILKNSNISGIIVTSTLRYSDIRDNMYSGYFAFNSIPKPCKFLLSPTMRLYMLILKDARTNIVLNLADVPNLVYLNIARSAFSAVDDAPKLRYMNIRHCNVHLGTYPALQILDARYATYTGPPVAADTIVFAEGSPQHIPEYVHKYTILRELLRQCATLADPATVVAAITTTHDPIPTEQMLQI
jgi:hypothetical protein